MAGTLGIRLAGPVSYDGHRQDKPWIGDGDDADSHSARRALAIYVRACGLLWIIALEASWLL